MDYFNILPTEITTEILTRLPTEELLGCKLVSKTWRNLIQHPSFSKMHVNRLNNYADSGKLGFLALAANTNQLYYFEHNGNHEKPIEKIITINIGTRSLKNFSTYVGSVNGLICLTDMKNRFCVCNPMTRECVILPRLKISIGQLSSGFGYLPSTNEYKVVVLYREANSVEAFVYTLGSGHGWRNLGKVDFNVQSVSYHRPGVCLNGVLYLMCSSRVIVVFDLVNENFLEQLAPPITSPVGSYYPNTHTLGDLGGFLFYNWRGYNFNNQQISNDIWLYKNNLNHVKKEQQKPYQSLAWTEEFRLPKGQQPLAYNKSGDILSYSSKYLDTYDPITSISKRLLDFKEEFGIVFPHNNTLVSLKELEGKRTRTIKSVKNKKS